MAKVLDLPKLSPTMEEGQIAKWHKKEGDAVGVDDLLAEVETDKATMEYRSFDKGTLLKILAPAGAVVRLGEPVAILGTPGEDISALGGGSTAADAAKASADSPPPAPDAAKASADSPPPAPDAAKASADSPPPAPDAAKASADSPPPAPDAAKASADSPSPAPDAAKASADSPPPAPDATPGAGLGPTGRVKASPYVRKMARDQGFDLTAVPGSGPGGRIIARDLANVQPAAAPAAVPVAPAASPAPVAPVASVPAAPGELVAPEVRPLSMMRKAIARRLTESKQTVPHFYLTIDVDADALHTLREQINADLLAGHGEGAPKVSFNDLVVKACAIALVRVPECNAQFAGDAIWIHRRVDISVAVSVAEGLMTPVVRHADQKSVLQISAEVRDLAGRAKAKKLKPEEMQNGTFSISNLGMFGIDAFAAVINPPEGAILAVGQVRREPVVKGDAVVPGRKLALTLSCDHRVIDGAVGATFLRALRQILEHPTQILIH
jgi:pyruvate dehydrogenase E2 component (dihydrolipoamide acetyltransferase)